MAQLRTRGAFVDRGLLVRLLTAAQEGLSLAALERELRLPASVRLGFRERGLAIDLSARALLQKDLEEGLCADVALRALLQDLGPHAALGPPLVALWRAPAHQRARSWTEHRDINEVMLATSLLPEGYLVL